MCQPKHISSLNVLPCSIDRRVLLSALPLRSAPSAPRKDTVQKRVRFSIPENPPSKEKTRESSPTVKRGRTYPTMQKASGRWEPVMKTQDNFVSPLRSIPVRRASFETHDGDSRLLPGPRHEERPIRIAPHIAPRRNAHPPMKKGVDGHWIPVGFFTVTGEGAELSPSLSRPVRRRSVDRIDMDHCLRALLQESDELDHWPTEEPLEIDSVDYQLQQTHDCGSMETARTSACLKIPARRLSADRDEKASSKTLCMPTRRGSANAY